MTTGILGIITSVQAIYGMLLIIGLLIYIAFYKDAPKKHSHKRK